MAEATLQEMVERLTGDQIEEIYDYAGVSMYALTMENFENPRFVHAMVALRLRAERGDPTIPIDVASTMSAKEIGPLVREIMEGGEEPPRPTEPGDGEDAPKPARSSGSRGSRASTASARGKSGS